MSLITHTCDACHEPVAGESYSFRHRLTGDRIFGCATCLDRYRWLGWLEFKYDAQGHPIAVRRNDDPWIAK